MTFNKENFIGYIFDIKFIDNIYRELYQIYFIYNIKFCVNI